MHRPKRRYRHTTPEKAQEIRRRYFRREATQRELAEEYRLAQSSVSRIVSGYVWSSPVSRRGKVPMAARPCDMCGEPCHGRRCEDCRRACAEKGMAKQPSLYGVPPELR